MMISAFARGYQVLGEERFLEAAEKAAEFMLSTMMRGDVLLRTYRFSVNGKAEGSGKLPAYLDDYAETANALVDLYEATFDLRWLEDADRLARRMLADFWDERDGGFFYTSDLHTDLLTRTKPFYDGAVPSGNSTAALVLLRLAGLLDCSDYREKARTILSAAHKMMLAQPRAYLNLMCAVDFFLRPVREVAIAGKQGSVEVRRFLEVIHRRFIPNKIVALVEPGTPDSAVVEQRVPLLRHKEMISGRAAVYVCRDYNCKLPVTNAEELGRILDEGEATSGRAEEPRSLRPQPREGEP
jgi:uncharacterized protein YyaL (SSP411 family)